MTNYDILLKQASELLESEPWVISAMSNISSLSALTSSFFSTALMR